MELLHVADAVAREKNIERDEVLEAMEQAIQKAGRSKYGLEHDIRAHIDRKSGDIQLARFVTVIDDEEEMEDEVQQIRLADAQRKDASLNVGDEIVDELPPIDFGRIAAQTAKQVIVQRVRDAERKRQFEEYKDRVGEVVNGLVKRVEFGNVTVDLGKAEGVIRRDESIPREHVKVGDRIRAYIMDVREEVRGPQIFLSRAHPDFMAKLFAMEVPEIYDGIVEIRAVARDPGSRAKIAVISNDGSIDPVGACVGMRGSRVQAVVGELQGEKIDIINHSESQATFIVNALAPAEVSKVLMDDENNRIDVVVPDDQLSLAIGRRGQNVRLASMLTGWHIDIMTEDEESQKRQAEMRKRSELFITALGVDEVIANLLALEGFVRLEDIAYIELDELKEINGLDPEQAESLQERAQTHLEAATEAAIIRYRELGVSEDLEGVEELTPAMLVKLGENNVFNLDDFADLAADELVEIVGEEAIGQDDAETFIMAMRQYLGWFGDEEEEEGESYEEGEEGEDGDAEYAEEPASDEEV